jgi:hypothetical protein
VENDRSSLTSTEDVSSSSSSSSSEDESSSPLTVTSTPPTPPTVVVHAAAAAVVAASSTPTGPKKRGPKPGSKRVKKSPAIIESEQEKKQQKQEKPQQQQAKIVKIVKSKTVESSPATTVPTMKAKRLEKENKDGEKEISMQQEAAKKAKLEIPLATNKTSVQKSLQNQFDKSNIIANATTNSVISGRIISLGSGFKIPKRPRYITKIFDCCILKNLQKRFKFNFS